MRKSLKFGLIGKNISYSFSKKYFESKFQSLGINNTYDLFHLDDISNVEDIFKLPDLKGLNVTIPYKELVIPYLDALNEEAEKIGAVNCIAFKDGKKIGYNTDVFGFEKTLLTEPKCLEYSALVLGNGGAAKAVRYILEKYKIPYQTISRNIGNGFNDIDYELVKENKIIVQCTPVGTFPNVDDCLPFDFEGITKEHFVIDLIYNPVQTKFLKQASEKGARVMNGMLMLEQQAEKAWEIWNLM